MKKTFAFFLSVILLINCCFINSKAAVLSGEGTKESPFVITNAEELNEVRNNLNAYYILNNDIDLTNIEFLPIGNNTTPFAGYFNGNGKKITGLTMSLEGHAYDVYIEEETEDDTDDGYTSGSDSGWTGDYEIGGANKPEAEQITKIPKYIGLFGVNSGEIYDLHIENANITVNALNEEVYVGAFCGLNKGQVYRSYSTVTTLNSFAVTDYCGGISGQNASGATIGNCFSNARVSANGYAGGLAGLNKGYVACSYYNGFEVRATNVDAICNNSGTVQYNYYLEGAISSAHATMLTAREFAYSSYFTGFNFSSVWQINSTLKQPELKKNPYPVKSVATAPNAPTVQEIVGNKVVLETDGSLLFSNDGVNYSYNNTFEQAEGMAVKYYAKYAETVDKYQSAASAYLELTISKSFDVNGDGEENSKDLTQLRRYLADWDVTVIEENLDINDDNDINSKDATYLARYLADWYI